MPSPPRLIDLHTDWLLQYAPETDLYSPQTATIVAGSIPQAEGYLGATSAAVVALYREAEDWESRPDPWAALAALMARVEAEFSGRLLIGPEDWHRWEDDPHGLTWAVMGVEGFDFLIRNPQDLGRLGGLFARGVRIFQPIYGPATALGGSSSLGDDRGLTALGRAFLESVSELSSSERGPRPALDLAHMNPATRSDVLDWFEADPARPMRAVPIYSHGGLEHEGFDSPRALRREDLVRLRALGGTVGFGVTPPFYQSQDAIRSGIETAMAIPFLGRAGAEGIAIGTDFLGVQRTLPGLGSAPDVVAWAAKTFSPPEAEAILRGNGRALFGRLVGVES